MPGNALGASVLSCASARSQGGGDVPTSPLPAPPEGPRQHARPCPQGQPLSSAWRPRHGAAAGSCQPSGSRAVGSSCAPQLGFRPSFTVLIYCVGTFRSLISLERSSFLALFLLHWPQLGVAVLLGDPGNPSLSCLCPRPSSPNCFLPLCPWLLSIDGDMNKLHKKVLWDSLGKKLLLLLRKPPAGSSPCDSHVLLLTLYLHVPVAHSFRVRKLSSSSPYPSWRRLDI